MRAAVAVTVLVLLGAACVERYGSLDLRIRSVQRASIDAEVRNNTAEDLVFLNPEAPTRQVDDSECVLILSTKVLDDVRPYAFTPRLERVDARSSRRFTAILEPISLSPSCSQWSVKLEYAYVLPKDVEDYKGRPFEDFRQHVLRTQRVVSASSAERVGE